ncbi:hypothetical protein GSI_13276 [Ganoderma sinense ZZ0214-1]|uniref:Epoxide hydrolase N-terminal domain-containing protein n=1 Tax=Ganoderma sinense ZZ0214-1 TaxID=1077348 RepID=A0A2G8RV41_9APHY|nr:hypothetical protein GSI_13276 [Ganoderma sinense ZZ0214-1]
MSKAPRPFKLAVPDADLDVLHQKLELARFPDELEGAGWEYGTPLADMKRLTEHWKNGFNWRKTEAEINKLPMFTRDIEVEGFGTLNVHFVHQVSDVRNAIPLLFVHGWLGSFLEVRKILPMLTAGGEDHPSFHVVAPSLPGFAFSEAPHKPGFRGPQYAELLNKLMLSLGYDEYVYQGGDWGHIIGKHAAFQYAHKHIKAWHTNMPWSIRPTFMEFPLIYIRTFLAFFFDKAFKELIASAPLQMARKTGYLKVQSTRPQTLGYSLADSPVGLLGWMYEKFVAGSDNYPWTEDEGTSMSLPPSPFPPSPPLSPPLRLSPSPSFLLEWISIYYFSRAGPTASTRIYYEMSGGGQWAIGRSPGWTTIPLGVSYFPREIPFPRIWVGTIGNVVVESEHDKGGHFPAFEVPEKLVADVRAMFGRGGPAHGVVPGKDGYDG